MKRYGILCLIFALVLFAFSMAGQTQEKYPHRPIEVVVPFGPGGVADVIARIYSEELSRELKVSITVVNRAGGTGIQGTIYVINSKRMVTPSSVPQVHPFISCRPSARKQPMIH